MTLLYASLEVSRKSHEDSASGKTLLCNLTENKTLALNICVSATFEVLTAVTVKTNVLWVVAPVIRYKFENLVEECTISIFIL
jgi:hypothetical protein